MTSRGAIVFGLGDDATDRIGLDWAAREARARNRPLHIVRAFHQSASATPWQMDRARVAEGELRRVADELIEQAVTHVRTDWPDVVVVGEAVDGMARDILIERSVDADLTVLGARTLSVVEAALLGSVSTAVAARARGPVVVAAGPPGAAAEYPIVVVGVDPRAGNDDVLSFAFEHASRHGLALHAILCWRRDAIADARWGDEHPAPPQATRWLAEATAGWQEKYPDVRVHRGVIRAHPVDGLVAQSYGQDLLVVGGHQPHARWVPTLGSVSQGVLHHATCPVAVVHTRRPAD